MIKIYFGNPGCGKTTFACRVMHNLQKADRKKKKLKKLYWHYFSNFETKLADPFPLSDLGVVTPPPRSFLCIDEAGIVYNSRKYKSLSQQTIAWFKLHRHFKADVMVISQSWEDMDVTIRRLADELWYLRRLGPFTMARRIYKKVGIDENTKQIIDEYRKGSLLMHLLPFPFHQHNFEIFLRRPYYKYFDTFSTPDMPIFWGKQER